MMRSTAMAVATAAGSAGRALADIGRNAFALLCRASARTRQRRALAELDERLLRDIGRTKEEARREAAKSAWRG